MAWVPLKQSIIVSSIQSNNPLQCIKVSCIIVKYRYVANGKVITNSMATAGAVSQELQAPWQDVGLYLSVLLSNMAHLGCQGRRV